MLLKYKDILRKLTKYIQRICRTIYNPIANFIVRPIFSICRAKDLQSIGRWFDPGTRRYFTGTIDLFYIESNRHLSVTVDSEIMWDQQSDTFGEIGYHWFVIKKKKKKKKKNNKKTAGQVDRPPRCDQKALKLA